jgi:hypothetical protein
MEESRLWADAPVPGDELLGDVLSDPSLGILLISVINRFQDRAEGAGAGSRFCAGSDIDWS